MNKATYEKASRRYTILKFLEITSLVVLILVSIASAGQFADQINSPNSSINLYNKGVALVNLGKLDEAIKAYDKAIEINPQYADAWYNKGNILCQLGKFDEGIKAYDKTIEINPKYSNAWYNKGNALDDSGRHDEAIKAYDKAIELNQ